MVSDSSSDFEIIVFLQTIPMKRLSNFLFFQAHLSTKISMSFKPCFVFIFFCLAALFFWLPLYSQEPDQTLDTETRQVIDLNGEWSFKKKGETDWRKIVLPSPTEKIGDLFFRRTFEIPANIGDSQFFIVFEGINFSSRIKLNDQYLSSQSYGHTSILTPIPKNLLRLRGSNVLEVEVNTSLGNKTIPLRQALLSPLPLRGIFRDIYLTIQPAMTISSVVVKSELANSLSAAKLDLEIEILSTELAFNTMVADNDSPKVVCVVRDEESNQILATAEQSFRLNNELKNQIQLSMEFQNPKLWSLVFPNRYSVEVRILYKNKLIDEVEQKIGIRELKLDNNHLFLNGELLPVKGVTFLENKSRILTDEQALTLLQEIKSNGFNTITWHNPPPAHVLELTDSLGLLNILRVPLWNVPGAVLSDPEFSGRMSSLLGKMVQLASNHASVLALSLGDGFDASSVGTQSFISDQLNVVGTENQFFITSGFRNYDSSLSEFAFDFITFNLTLHGYSDWRKWLANWIDEGSGIPILYSDISVPYTATRSDSENVSIYEAIQAQKLKKLIEDIQKEPTLGFMLAALYDWQISYPSVLSLKTSDRNLLPIGLFTVSNEPRMSLSMMQNLNKGTGYQFEFQQNTIERFDTIFIVYGLIVIVLFLIFFRRDHRLRGNFIRILSRPFGFYIELKDGRKIPWFTTSIILITSASSWGLILGSVFSFLRHHPLFDFLISQFSPSNTVNIVLIYMSWYPILGIIGFSLWTAVLITVLAFYVLFLSLITRRRLSIRNSLTLVYWESCIFIFLLPVAFIFYRLMIISPIRLLLLLLLIIFLIWYIYRIFTGIRTVFTIRPGMTIALFVGIPIILILVLDILYNQSNGLNAQLVYLIHLWYN